MHYFLAFYPNWFPGYVAWLSVSFLISYFLFLISWDADLIFLHKKTPTFRRGRYWISWFWKLYDAAYMPLEMVSVPSGLKPFFIAICKLLRCICLLCVFYFAAQRWNNFFDTAKYFSKNIFQRYYLSPKILVESSISGW